MFLRISAILGAVSLEIGTLVAFVGGRGVNDPDFLSEFPRPLGPTESHLRPTTVEGHEPVLDPRSFLEVGDL